MIKLVVFDFDGVFTDGKVFFNSDGNIMKFYNVKDGLGLKLLQQKNIHIGVISGYKENNSQVHILKHLQIPYVSMGDNNKLTTLLGWCNKLNINLETEVAFMGDDINDMDIIKRVGLSGCPNDGHKNIKYQSMFISMKDGGDGCIRDFCDYILAKKST